MKKLKLFIVLLFFGQWIWFMLFFFIFSRQPRQIRSRIVNDTPTAFTEQRNYFSDLSDFAVQGSYLYVLYDNAAVMEVYQTDGAYVRSYAYPWYSNGSGKLLATEDSIWMIDRSRKRHLFRDGVYLESSPGREYSDYAALKSIAKSQNEARTDENNLRYLRRGTSIYQQNGDALRCVVRRPFYDYLMQGHFPWLQHFIVILALGSCVVIEKRREKA